MTRNSMRVAKVWMDDYIVRRTCPAELITKCKTYIWASMRETLTLAGLTVAQLEVFCSSDYL